MAVNVKIRSRCNCSCRARCSGVVVGSLSFLCKVWIRSIGGRELRPVGLHGLFIVGLQVLGGFAGNFLIFRRGLLQLLSHFGDFLFLGFLGCFRFRSGLCGLFFYLGMGGRSAATGE